MKVVVLGAGWCGLTTAMLLNRDGHDVVVIEKDPAPPSSAEDAWTDWPRPGVAQFRQPHLIMPGANHLLEAELPEINAQLRAAGGCEYSIIQALSRMLPDVAAQWGDRYSTVNARRPVIERTVASIAEAEIDVRRGCAATELICSAADLPGVPHVAGVRLASGEQLRADLVVDTMGRRSPLATWLAAAGAHEPGYATEGAGFTYYTQYFESVDGSVPEFRGPGLMPIGTFSVLTILSDNRTWSITVFVQSHDQELKEIRRPEAFQRVIAACPVQAHWLEGRPVGGIAAMSGVMDQRRSFVRDDKPVATGVIAVGDAWASTNPSLGRGLSIGLLQARTLRDVLQMGLDPGKLATQWATVTAERFDPWYRSCVLSDRDRMAEIDAIREGRPVPPPADPMLHLRVAGIAARDPELLAASFDISAVYDPPDAVLARPGIQERLAAVEVVPTTLAAPGPDRAQLLSLIHGD